MALGQSGSLPPMGGGMGRSGIGMGSPSAQSKLEPEPLGDLTMSGALRAASSELGGGPSSAQAEERKYKRTPALTGKGAVRCKTFHTKLNDAALTYMDEMVNTWLEQHGYEAKFSQMTIGTFQGKSLEQHLIVQVWY